jgi:Uma2 family endonuclease
MSSTTLVPVEEYLRYSEKPNCEYREGVLYPKPMPTTFHGLLEFMLVAMLRKLGLQAAPEVTVRLSPTRYLVPDVIAAPVLHSPYPTEAVLLCCEILSPRTALAPCSPSARNITPGAFPSAGSSTPSSALRGNIIPPRSLCV